MDISIEEALAVTNQTYKMMASSRNMSHANLYFWQDMMCRFSLLNPEGKVLDLACGAGRDSTLLRRLNYQYLGIDNCLEMLTAARNLDPEADFRQMDMYNLDFADSTFEGIWAPASLLHVPKSKVVSVLKEVKRVLKPDHAAFFAVKEDRIELKPKHIDGRVVSYDSVRQPVSETMVPGRYGERFFAFYYLEEFAEKIEEAGLKVLSRERDGRELAHANTTWLLYFAAKPVETVQPITPQRKRNVNYADLSLNI
jgi:SAM-dependent methyltransferase